MKIISSESGISIIEVLMVAGMVALMGMSFASMMSTQQNASKHLQQTMEANQITEAVRAMLNDPLNCEENLKGKSTATNAFLTELKNENGNVFWDQVTGGALGEQLRVTNVEMVAGTYVVPGLPGRSAVMMKLHFGFRDNRDGTPLKPREIDVLVETSAGTISSCSSQTTKSLLCVPEDRRSSGRSVSVSCDPGYNVYSCGYYDDNPDKQGARGHYPQGNGCYCYDNDDSGEIRCFAVCCQTP